jgi:hypothetical protein
MSSDRLPSFPYCVTSSSKMVSSGTVSEAFGSGNEELPFTFARKDAL